jgi:hypothetical protein
MEESPRERRNTGVSRVLDVEFSKQLFGRFWGEIEGKGGFLAKTFAKVWAREKINIHALMMNKYLIWVI